MQTRVRFAPSPTGFLHIGGARTALFNWLFARRTQGVFILRIEDTDVERSSHEMVRGILDGLDWLGIDWDEGPYFQSQRLELYRSLALRLLDEGHAYRCFCPQDDRPETASTEHHCREMTSSESEARDRQGEPFALRFKVPSGRCVQFVDKVFGSVQVQADLLDDFVILRSDRTPTYHLSVVADDVDMKISHVVRGADHLSNTAKHILLFEALGEPRPAFAHLPLILGPDKKRLSKRHGATSVLEYRQAGYLPQAMRNYLALLGWSPGDDREFFTDSDLQACFDLDRINKANAVFDVRKLEWMNGRVLTALGAEDIEAETRQVLEAAGLWNPAWANERRAWFLETVGLLKKGIRRLTDFADSGRAFFTDDFQYDSQAVDKYLALGQDEPSTLRQALSELAAGYADLQPFDLETTEAVLRGIVDHHGLKAGKFIGAVRVALTGRAHAPGIFEVIVCLGRERTLQRLQRAGRFLENSPSRLGEV